MIFEFLFISFLYLAQSLIISGSPSNWHTYKNQDTEKLANKRYKCENNHHNKTERVLKVV